MTAEKIKKMNQVIILGSGTSTGVPIPGCHCPVCLSSDSFNKRFRTSIFLNTASNKSILVDTTPDLRSQCLQNPIQKIDAVIITHDHADHVHGIDDLRPFCFGPPPKHIDVFTSSFCGEQLKERFPYIFQREKIFGHRPIIGGGIPLLQLQEVDLDHPYSLLDETFQFFLLPHGHTKTLGFLHQKFAYLTDFQRLSDPLVKKLEREELDLLLIDCLRRSPHSTHLHLEMTLSYIQRIKPKQAGLIHLSHEFDHQSFAKELRTSHGEHVFPVYDGQILEYSTGPN